VEKFLEPLAVRKLLWVGRKTEAKLKELGIKTIGDLVVITHPFSFDVWGYGFADAFDG
jgi:nucleotidyltransferase/DNA polymerase involved in DNA repair